MIIYAAEYCPDCYESAFGIISLHLSKEKAEAARDKHLKEEAIHPGFDIEAWRVTEYEVLP